MTHSVYKLGFRREVPPEKIENALLLTTVAAESLHGRAALRLDASFCLDLRARTFIINAETEIGSEFARIFTGFLSRTIGEDCFSVRLTEGKVPFLPPQTVCGDFR